jgi:crotonobetainyl-CoA:carnitine CoA-transferase CaiB-like acyl-CoA transferase
MKLLQNIRVVDFSQFLSGPSAGLRLADFGADVIKIERPGFGDICRRLYVSDVHIDGESTIFHAINRNKKSFVADLKDEEDLKKVEALLLTADVMINNFRPGVIEKLGLGYDRVKEINPKIIYAEITGYGNEGPWRDRPGQDLLLQAASGITYLSGNSDDDPTPMGVAVADIYSGTHLVQGILAALYRKNITGVGTKVSVSMLESLLDYQFEVLTSYYNDNKTLPVRSSVNNAHAYVAAPYGIYQTADGYIALAMTSITVLSRILECPPLAVYDEPAEWFVKRDEIKQILAAHLQKNTTGHWLDRLEPEDIWCAEVLNYERLIDHEGYQCLQMEQLVRTSNGLEIKTTRCPIRVDGMLLLSDRGAPLLGEHNSCIESLNT